jgi:uncharacterized protein (DUF2147 family)
MLRKGMIVAALFVALGAPAAIAAAPNVGGGYSEQTGPTGLWITANHNAVIQINTCGPDLCGRIVGLVRNPGQPVPTDWQGASQCGLTIIHTAPTSDGSAPAWSGSILDPRNGASYKARITLGQDNQLQLRGYLGIPLFGETQTWTRYEGPTGPQCEVQVQNDS